MNNKPIEFIGAKLHTGQRRIIDDILKGTHKYSIINASRQSGKSYLLKQLLLYFSLNYEKTESLVVSPYTSQNLKIYDEVINAIIQSGVVIRHNRTEKTIHFINGSKLFFKPAENPEAIRGGSYNWVFCDEFAFFKPDVFKDVINITMVAKLNSRCFIFSTPAGKNEFWEYSILGQDKGELNYKYYFMNYRDNPNFNLEFVEDCRNKYPKLKFQQEFEGAFVDNASVFNNYEKCAVIDQYSKPEPGMKYFAGLDLANRVDETVLTILDEDGQNVYNWAIRDVKWSHIIAEVIRICNEYNNAHLLVEANNIGDPIFEMLSDKYNNCHSIWTTNQNKADYIENLIKAFSEIEIFIPTNSLEPALHTQLATFELSYSPKTRKTVYGARPGFHDDRITSLALANKARQSGIKRGVYDFDFI